MKTLTLISCVLVAVTCYSQKPKSKQINKIEVTDPTKFVGIGIFKIGSDTSVLYQYYEQNKKEILFKITESRDIGKRFFLANKNPEITNYFLSKYTVDGIEIKQIILTYYQNKLVGFKSEYNHDISDAITQKYGEPIFTSAYKDCECIYNLTGLTRKLQEETFTYIWKNGYIKAFYETTKKYDEHCKEVLDLYFGFNSKETEITTIEVQYRLKQAAAPQPKKVLKEF